MEVFLSGQEVEAKNVRYRITKFGLGFGPIINESVQWMRTDFAREG